MIYAARILCLILAIAVMAGAFTAPSMRTSASRVSMALADYKEEMAATAAKIAGAGT